MSVSVIWMMRGGTQDESRIKNARLGTKLRCCTIDFFLIVFDIYRRTDVTIILNPFRLFFKRFLSFAKFWHPNRKNDNTQLSNKKLDWENITAAAEDLSSYI